MTRKMIIQGVQVDDAAVDRLTTANKAFLSTLPVAGGILSEILGTVVPRQRIDRIAAVLQLLDQKIQQLELSNEVLRSLMTAEHFVDIFEDVVLQSARATSEERQKYLASFLATSLTSSELNAVKEKKLLYILGQLNDVEVLLLKFFSIPDTDLLADSFYELHREALEWPVMPEGAVEDVVQQTEEKTNFYRIHAEHLKTMGVCRNNFSIDGRMEPKHNTAITPIGELLLRYIGLR